MFEPQADLIAESQSFWVMGMFDLRGLTLMVTTEIFIKQINVNVSRKQVTHAITKSK